MLGSLYSSISGMKAHQTKLDVVGNNIANVNTTGYKKTSVNFEETMTQTIKGARGPIDGQGGINPATIGLGTKVSSINTSFESGAQQTTGRKTDLRIDGNGFFVVADGNNKMYTRSGNFNLDGNGNLVMPNGMKVQGWQATIREDGSQGIAADAEVGELAVKIGATLPGKATDAVNFAGNLNQNAGISNIALQVKDPTGQKVDVTIKFNYDVANNKWQWRAEGQGVTGKGAFELDDKGNIKKTFTAETTPIQNANGILIQSPIAGKITFAELADMSNRKTAQVSDNLVTTSAEVYDTLGNTHTTSVKYKKLADNVWEWEAGVSNGAKVNNGKGFLTFDARGQMNGNYLYADPNDAATLPDGIGTIFYESGAKNPDGTVNNGDPASNYIMDANGVIRYRGPAAPGLEPGQIMNKQFDFKVSFDPADNGSAPPPGKGAAPVELSLNFSGVSQFAANSTVSLDSQNGYGMGELETFNIADTGDIMGFYSNGYQQIIGRIALAKFTNQEGLQNAGGSLFKQTSNSGEAVVLRAGQAGLGKVAAGALEMSNVDLSQEFTDMIIAQRGFQANSKTISTADTILQELINLKR